MESSGNCFYSILGVNGIIPLSTTFPFHQMNLFCIFTCTQLNQCDFYVNNSDKNKCLWNVCQFSLSSKCCIGFIQLNVLKFIFKDKHVHANLHVIGLFEMASKIFLLYCRWTFDWASRWGFQEAAISRTVEEKSHSQGLLYVQSNYIWLQCQDTYTCTCTMYLHIFQGKWIEQFFSFMFVYLLAYALFLSLSLYI